MNEGISNKESSSRKGRASDQAPSPCILIVDDDEFVLNFLVNLLKDAGFAVIATASGEEAISISKSRPIDIAMIDYKLPGMDGLETIEKLAEIAPDVVSMVMTGFPTLDSSIKAIRLGASDYILKPFKLEEVYSSLEKAIKERAIRLEMKQLKRRVSEFEKNINGKKGSIKVNVNLEALRKLRDRSTSSTHISLPEK